MKRIILILCLILAGNLQNVIAQNERAKSELTQLLHEFMEGASNNDPKIHDRFWGEDLIYTSSSGERFGKERIMKGLEPGSGTKSYENAVYTAEDIQINVYGNMAVVAFRLVARGGETSDLNTFLNSGTFIKRQGEWKAVNWQATKE